VALWFLDVHLLRKILRAPIYESVHRVRTDWALTVLVLLQPIKSWRWRTWPANVSSLQLGRLVAVQFMCCEQTFSWPRHSERCSFAPYLSFSILAARLLVGKSTDALPIEIMVVRVKFGWAWCFTALDSQLALQDDAAYACKICSVLRWEFYARHACVCAN